MSPVQANDVRRALALAAVALLSASNPRQIVAVTGTSGKSSVADFTRQLFAHLGHKSASLGTLGVITSDGTAYGSLTTPDPSRCTRRFDRLARDGVTRLAMEASSHGIDQRRLDGVRLACGGLHQSRTRSSRLSRHTEAYAAAKLRLFDTLLPGDAPAIINADGPYADVFLRRNSPSRTDPADHRQHGRDAAACRGAPGGLWPGADGRGIRPDVSRRAFRCWAPSRSRTLSSPRASCSPWKAKAGGRMCSRACQASRASRGGSRGRRSRRRHLHRRLRPQARCAGACARCPASLHDAESWSASSAAAATAIAANVR